MSASQSTHSGPVTPSGLNHLVLNVRNLEESHRFWTEIARLQAGRRTEGHAAAPEPSEDAVLQRRP